MFNFRKLHRILVDTDWSFIDADCDINQAVAAFTNVITSAFPSSCPLFKSAPNPKFTDRALRLLKSDKNRAQRAYRLNNTLLNLCVYKYAANA